MTACNRKFPRVEVNFPVLCEIVKWTDTAHHPQNAMTATCQDLSARGICFDHAVDLDDKTLQKLREGVLKFNLEFTLPEDDKPINLLGRMIYCGYDEEKEEEDEEDGDDEQDTGQGCTGVLFIDIDSRNYSKINDFIQTSIP